MMKTIMTFEGILERMLDKVTTDVDKRQGSVIYDALAPAAAELAQMFVELENFGKYSFADEASGEFLSKRCAERGINRKKASPSVRLGKFNIPIEIGSRFQCENSSYYVEKAMETEDEYRLVCEQKGIVGNIYEGDLTAIEEISGLDFAQLLDILIPGEDTEDDESLRRRYFDSLKSEAFGGNITDYKEKVKAIDGIGGVKVEPVWNGPGTIKLVIIDGEYGSSSTQLIDRVQSIIDPDVNSGKGYGIAPVGHTVTVCSADEVGLSISTSVVLDDEFRWEDVHQFIVKAVKDYFLELRKSWEENSKLVVRISQIESAILRVTGVIDVTDTLINNNKVNKILNIYDIPKLESVVKV